MHKSVFSEEEKKFIEDQEHAQIFVDDKPFWDDIVIQMMGPHCNVFLKPTVGQFIVKFPEDTNPDSNNPYLNLY